jgi:hypothetical protein
MRTSKVYLGDAVYIDHDGYNVILTTENGYEATNTIVLEPAVLESLLSYVKQLVTNENPE